MLSAQLWRTCPTPSRMLGQTLHCHFAIERYCRSLLLSCQALLFSASDRWDALKFVCNNAFDAIAVYSLNYVHHVVAYTELCTLYIAVQFQFLFPSLFLCFVPCFNENFPIAGQLKEHLIFLIKASMFIMLFIYTPK